MPSETINKTEKRGILTSKLYQTVIIQTLCICFLCYTSRNVGVIDKQTSSPVNPKPISFALEAKMTVKFNVVERGNPSNREEPKKFYASVGSKRTTMNSVKSAKQPDFQGS